MCCIQVGAMSQPSVSGFTAGPANASMYKVRVPRWGTYNVVYLKFWSKFSVGWGEGVYPKEGVLHGGVLGTLWSDDDDSSDSNNYWKIDFASFQTFLWLFELLQSFWRQEIKWQLKREDPNGSQKDTVKLITLLFTLMKEQDGNETLATQATDNISFCQFDWGGVYLQYTITVFFTSTLLTINFHYFLRK